jgi:hypothetical protein
VEGRVGFVIMPIYASSRAIFVAVRAGSRELDKGEGLSGVTLTARISSVAALQNWLRKSAVGNPSRGTNGRLCTPAFRIRVSFGAFLHAKPKQDVSVSGGGLTSVGR